MLAGEDALFRADLSTYGAEMDGLVVSPGRTRNQPVRSIVF
jgi:hypothetical protein